MVELTVIDPQGNIVAGRSGIIGAVPMHAPWPAWDASVEQLGIAYLDAPYAGNVSVARFTLLP